MSDPVTGVMLRTDPKSFLVSGVRMLGQLVVPLAIAGFTIFRDGTGRELALYLLPIAIVVVGFNFAAAYLQWARLTYTVGDQDIRIESGVLSRSARSVPYERIQDVSLEEPLIARLFGLVSVKFETGAGGGEDISLSFLSNAEGERLRRLVRERREGEAVDAAARQEDEAAGQEEAQTLFAMGPRRLFTFGLFEFSLAVFAVLAGLLEYVDTFAGIEVWDPDLWARWFKGGEELIASLGMIGQALGVVAGLITVFVIGSATGLVRTFLRDWGFVLERTPRGFRRRRGLLTRTDVVMPVHRVQGITVGTRVIRYRFGWHGLKFVSLAQDAESSSHVVAPFARMGEIAPVVEAAGFRLPGEDTNWHRASENFRTDSVVTDGGVFLLAALLAGPTVAMLAPEWTLLVVGGLLALAAFGAGAALYSWHFRRHALDTAQIMSRAGLLSPQTQIATRLKLHSVEIAQGPIARARGYGTLHFGLAGGEFAIAGVPIKRAHEVRREVLKTISATDFSRLETQRAD